MDQEIEVLENGGNFDVPVDLVPTPTAEYRAHRKTSRFTLEPGEPLILRRVPLPRRPWLILGSRVLMWKQDPSVKEIRIRKAYLPGLVLNGPRDFRITVQGLPMVSRNVYGDFIHPPGTTAFDAVHTFTVVRQTLTMYQRAMKKLGHPVPWQWNSKTNKDPLEVHPRGLPDTMNAYYSRSRKCLKFGHFMWQRPGRDIRVYTCRSLDIVSHETGHAILDGMKPNWIGYGNPPQTGALHESFADLSAVFLALSQFDQVEAIIAQTKANLHNKTFLADLAEQFGLALGRSNGLRNADNNLKLSQVSNQVHALSQVFTGGIYDIMADIFRFERSPGNKDDAMVLYETAEYMRGLLLRALWKAPAKKATYVHVINHMRNFMITDGKPLAYRNFLRNQFVAREVINWAAPLTEDVSDDVDFEAGIQDEPDIEQDRRACCGTMQLPEYNGEDEVIKEEADEFAGFFA